MSFYYRTELRKKSSLIRKTSLFLREKRPCSLHSRLIFYLLFGPDGTVEGFRLSDLIIRDLIQRIGDGFKGLRAGALQRSRIQRILSEAFCEILGCVLDRIDASASGEGIFLLLIDCLEACLGIDISGNKCYKMTEFMINGITFFSQSDTLLSRIKVTGIGNGTIDGDIKVKFLVSFQSSGIKKRCQSGSGNLIRSRIFA